MCWPKDLLPREMPNVRVLSFAYDADIYGNTSVAGIRGNAEALLARLRDLRDDRDYGRPIVFVAHSLGGIVLKRVRESIVFTGSPLGNFSADMASV